MFTKKSTPLALNHIIGIDRASHPKTKRMTPESLKYIEK
jgi:hypothetical protein